jgi:hypothetical protein
VTLYAANRFPLHSFSVCVDTDEITLLTAADLLCAGSLTPAFAATNDDDRGLRLWMKDRLAYQETSDTAPDKDQPLLQDPLSLSLEGKPTA